MFRRILTGGSIAAIAAGISYKIATNKNDGKVILDEKGATYKNNKTKTNWDINDKGLFFKSKEFNLRIDEKGINLEDLKSGSKNNVSFENILRPRP